MEILVIIVVTAVAIVLATMLVQQKNQVKKLNNRVRNVARTAENVKNLLASTGEAHALAMAETLEKSEKAIKKATDGKNTMKRERDTANRLSGEQSRRANTLAADLSNVESQLATSQESHNKYYSTETCTCPSCRILRKYPDYGYVNRVKKAIARGDAG